MKKLISILLLISILALSACKFDKNTLVVKTQDGSEVIENSGTDEKTQAEINALKLIPAEFTEALSIETKRQNALINGCSADKDNATYDAFNEMKAVYKTLCTQVENKLDDNQKTLFKDFLAKERQYNIAFDMFSSNALKQYVYTTGNAACNEDYNIMRTKSVIMYRYYNFLTENNIDNAKYTSVLDENYYSFFFFNSEKDVVKGKSANEINKIDNVFSPLLKNIFKENSQPVFEDYKKSLKDYMSAQQAFENSIDMKGDQVDNLAFYNCLNADLIYKLYNTINDKKYPEDIAKLFNLNADKDQYTSKWN